MVLIHYNNDRENLTIHIHEYYKWIVTELVTERIPNLLKPHSIIKM